MPDHVPRLCPQCGAPLPAARTCTSCGGRRRPLDPLQYAIEAIRPWVRGQRGIHI